MNAIVVVRHCTATIATIVLVILEKTFQDGLELKFLTLFGIMVAMVASAGVLKRTTQ